MLSKSTVLLQYLSLKYRAKQKDVKIIKNVNLADLENVCMLKKYVTAKISFRTTENVQIKM